MHVTQKDIARRLGISPSLVSRALRGTAGDIGAAEETVQRIRQEAQRVGYRCSAAALTLRGEPTQTLGIVVKDFADPYFGLLIGQLQRVAAAAGFSLVLTGCDACRLDAGALTKYRVDGLVVIGSEFAPQGLEPFLAAHTPVVQIGTGPTVPGLARVCMAEAAGLGQLLDYLAGLGHREIGYLGDGSPAMHTRARPGTVGPVPICTTGVWAARKTLRRKLAADHHQAVHAVLGQRTGVEPAGVATGQHQREAGGGGPALQLADEQAEIGVCKILDHDAQRLRGLAPQRRRRRTAAITYPLGLLANPLDGLLGGTDIAGRAAQGPRHQRRRDSQAAGDVFLRDVHRLSYLPCRAESVNLIRVRLLLTAARPRRVLLPPPRPSRADEWRRRRRRLNTSLRATQSGRVRPQNQKKFD